VRTPRKLKHTEDRIVALLKECGPLTASDIGSRLWGRASRKPQSYALPAGKLLALLSRQGKVVKVREEVLTRWKLVR
jgi:hypothetical protein